MTASIHSNVCNGSRAPVRSIAKLPIAQHIVLSSIELSNVSNAERLTPFVLADERRRLHFVTGRSEWRVRSERRAGCGRWRVPATRRKPVGELDRFASGPV
jgi:hypothetical protein